MKYDANRVMRRNNQVHFLQLRIAKVGRFGVVCCSLLLGSRAAQSRCNRLQGTASAQPLSCATSATFPTFAERTLLKSSRATF